MFDLVARVVVASAIDAAIVLAAGLIGWVVGAFVIALLQVAWEWIRGE